MNALGVRGSVPLQRFDERSRFDGGWHQWERRDRKFACRGHTAGMRLIQHPEEIADSLRRTGCCTHKPHVESPFDPQDEFGAAQAVDAEIPFQAARRGNIHAVRALRMEFQDKVSDDGNKLSLA
jgi:hypothetical protein